MSRSRIILLTALSLSIGWGIRGNFGHEIGAMIPGALAAIAAVVTIGRDDWMRRIGYFAFFGAIGWSFGGSMSYGQVLGYTHSGHSLSILYGFASLFLIGFLWGAVGGAGTALPAVLDRRRLTEFFLPLTVIFIAWWMQDFFEEWLVTVNSDYRQQSPLYWYDTDWLGVLVAIVVVTLLALIRRRFDDATSLILHLAVGWWAGFVILVLVFGLRMTPPRGDNWAGCLGMVAGMLIFFERRGLRSLTYAALVSGFVGGFGFAFANLIKLIGVATGWQTNWHSVMEQSYGAINGIGIALVLIQLARQEKPVTDENEVSAWTDVYAISFVLLGITYLNFRRNPIEWVKAEAVPQTILGISAGNWFALAYLALTVMFVAVILRHRKTALAFIPVSWRGKAQLFYLVLLWWVVVGNFERSVVAFAPARLITEGVIFLNAVICTALLLFDRGPEPISGPAAVTTPAGSWSMRRTIAAGFAGMVICVVLSWAVVRAIFGDQVAGAIKRQIRFGPEATATTDRPAAGQPHP
ncbi:MAG: hypothetical protein ABI882_11195 [Acidobacteriota bacterium]